ncbi:hypothetical protein A3H84_03220 [Candidatus Roizmanbacteria bacterium RIFCSPLOWO2_02_FULL_40_13]|nr:MAG: hypothetical protein A3H84_03220 [Candidatus Roizmanbacteria bacterium RIFCSPLOWO2_02_FULL_40_13]
MKEPQSQMSDIKRRSFISTLSLFFQSGYSAFLGLVANLILTILLSPKVFGIYITVLSIISFLNYFSDIGLAGALIQKKKISEDDLTTTFTVQQGLTLILVIIGFICTSFVQNFYQLPPDGALLYQVLLVAFFISSMKTIPSIFLERKIKFEKIVLVQIVENTVFYIAISAFAVLGYGLTSFTIAVFLRAITGLALIYTLSFWMPKIGISVKSLKKLLSFGIPFQASSFLALFKDDLITLYLGKALGFEGLGYIGWAKKWADAPIRIVMDNVSKVLFPLMARYQDNKEKIRSIAEKILYYQTALIAPLLIGMIMTMKYVVDIIPNYQKWESAIPLFYIFALSSLILSFSAPFMNLFNALGKVKITFSFMIFFTVLTWVLTPFLTKNLGLLGFPIAHLIVSISFISVLLVAQRAYHFHFFGPVYKFFISSVVMAGVLFSLSLTVPPNTRLLLALFVSVGVFSYLFFITKVFGVNIKKETQSFLAKN